MLNFRAEKCTHYAIKQCIWWSYNKSIFHTEHFDRNLLTCLYAGGKALNGFIFCTFIGHIFKVTMRKAWQWKGWSIRTFCTQEEDSVSHLFWFCQVTETFKTDLAVLLMEKCSHHNSLNFSEFFILFGVDDLLLVLLFSVIVKWPFEQTCHMWYKLHRR